MSAPDASAATILSVEPPAVLLEALRRPQGSALMLGHVHPDGDVLGTLLGLGLAMEAAGWSVTYAGPDPVPDVLDFIPGRDRWQVWRTAPRRFDTVVLTDCPNDGRTEGLLAAVRGPESRVLNIDHHPDNRRYGTINWIDSSAAATGEMIHDLITALGWPIGPEVALGLYTAVHTDTGSFRYSNTTPKTFRVAARLVEAGVEPALVATIVYETRQLAGLRLLGQILQGVETDADGQIAWLVIDRKLAASPDLPEAEEFVNYPRSVRTAKVAVLFRELPDGVKVSMRAKGEVDVARIAGLLGGGGHPNAAGLIRRESLADAKAVVLGAIREALAAR